MVTIFVLYCACTKITSRLLDKVAFKQSELLCKWIIQNKLKASIIDFTQLFVKIKVCFFVYSCCC